MLGVKGLLYVELEVHGPSRDVHSSYATIIPNPAWRLAWALASLKGPDERILIDGFYDDVRSPTEEELATLHIMPDETQIMLEDLGMDRSRARRAGRRVPPPPHPRADLHDRRPDLRLAGPRRQDDPARDGDGEARLPARRRPGPGGHHRQAARAPRRSTASTTSASNQFSTEHPSRTDMADPFVDLAQAAAADAYGREAFIVPNFPATGPMYHFAHELGLPCVMAGVNYIGGRDHAPDEHIRIDDFRGGTKHIAAILQRFGEK